MLVALQLVGFVAVPLNVTVLFPCVAPKFMPEIVTDVLPTSTKAGFILVIFGVVDGGTVKLTPLLATPPTATTTLPVVAPLGTVATMLVVVSLQLVALAKTPLNVTVLVPCAVPKFMPEIVTEVPARPDVGFIAVMLGGVTPVPLSGIASGTISMLSGTLTVPVRLPATAGLNVTLIVHRPPTAIGDEDAQLSVSEKSPIALTGPTFKP
jgi:hypothetical protein